MTGVITLPEGVEMCMPGDNVEMDVELITPIAIEVGKSSLRANGGRMSIFLTGTQGNCRAKAFCGNYDIEVAVDGRRTIVNRDILRAPEALRVEICI